VNDTFGHIYGDEVLLLLSQLMKNTFRPSDLLFRFGGEEFVVIVQTENQKISADIFERFRIAVEKYNFPQVGQITISTGATRLMAEHAIASEIVGRADQALYLAKENGRNKLFLYEDLIKNGHLKKTIVVGDIELF
jgi:diguanylate cyclase (GGDEF)-like protein